MKPVAIVMGRLDNEDLPRNVVVAVSAERIYLLPVSRSGVGGEATSWSRRHVTSSAHRAGDGWAVWIQPPGDRGGFELRSGANLEADAVVAALMKQPD